MPLLTHWIVITHGNSSNVNENNPAELSPIGLWFMQSNLAQYTNYVYVIFLGFETIHYICTLGMDVFTYMQYNHNFCMLQLPTRPLQFMSATVSW